MQEGSLIFDPSIFDNLKIVLEGAVYDRDLDLRWSVIHREDLLDLACMSRTFRLQFINKDHPEVVARVSISSSIRDFASEWLIQQESVVKPGCLFDVSFIMMIEHQEICEQIQQKISEIWGGRPLIRQHLMHAWPQVASGAWQNEIQLIFDRKLDESHIADMDGVLDHIGFTLDYLNNLARS